MTSLPSAEQQLTVNMFATIGGAREYCITGSSKEYLPLREALNELAEAYSATLIKNGLDATTQHIIRIMLSDAVNDHEQVYASALYSLVSHGACSVIEQCPLDGGDVAIFAYHIKTSALGFSPESSPPKAQKSLQMKGTNYSFLWSPGFYCSTVEGSYLQTQSIFASLEAELAHYAMSIKNNTVRTWLYVRDIDNNYAGMVKARREYFSTIGLTDKTRYIASTGIEGKCSTTNALVTMDALSIGGLSEKQIIRMETPKHMSSTSVYGVTFERGTRVRFGDRSHLYISGTASIDHTGATIYLSDIIRQANRTFDNVEALLAPQGATLDNLLYLMVYLRNPKHYPLLRDVFSRRLPAKVPIVPVTAPVCRPEWLFEVDGLAIITDSAPFPPLA